MLIATICYVSQYLCDTVFNDKNPYTLLASEALRIDKLHCLEFQILTLYGRISTFRDRMFIFGIFEYSQINDLITRTARDRCAVSFFLSFEQSIYHLTSSAEG